jgi:hypothetical protein
MVSRVSQFQPLLTRVRVFLQQELTVTGKAFYESWPCACRSFKPQKYAERLRGLGNPPGDENGSDSMNYWEIVADKGQCCGMVHGATAARSRCHDWRWVIDRHREARRYIIHSNELLSAFL